MIKDIGACMNTLANNVVCQKAGFIKRLWRDGNGVSSSFKALILCRPR